MKRFVARLIVILTSLTLAGCVEDKPAPRLGSSEPTERIEAVRNAQNRYGKHAAPAKNRPAQALPVPSIQPVSPQRVIVLPGDRPAIVGRWNQLGKKDTYFQFNADGTFEDVGQLNTSTGRWRFLSADTIEFSAIKHTNILLFWAPSSTECKIRREADALWLKFSASSSSFIRATDKEKQP